MAELAASSETSRQRALECFELLRAHLEDGRPLVAIARETRMSYRTLQSEPGYNKLPALRFKKCYVDKEDVQTLLDQLFFQRAVQTYLWLFA